MRWTTLWGYKVYTRHMVMAVLVILLIITNIVDEIAVRYWDFTWNERKIAETVFIILGGIIICPIIYRKYFIYQDEKTDEEEDDNEDEEDEKD